LGTYDDENEIHNDTVEIVVHVSCIGHTMTQLKMLQITLSDIASCVDQKVIQLKMLQITVSDGVSFDLSVSFRVTWLCISERRTLSVGCVSTGFWGRSA
jgi:hypothetical protein